MPISIEATLGQCRDLVKTGLIPFVEGKIQAEYGNGWERRAGCKIVGGKPHWDLQALLKAMILHWNEIFAASLAPTVRSLAFELKEWRNHVAHEHEMTLEDTSRFIDTAARLLKGVSAPETAELEILRMKVLQELVANADNNRSAQVAPAKFEAASRKFVSITAISDDIASAVTPSWTMCVKHIGDRFGSPLTRKSGRCAFTSDGNYGVCCLVSKEYSGNRYWWNLRERQLIELETIHHSFVAFACGNPPTIVLIPVTEIVSWLPTLNPKSGHDGDGWHVHILNELGHWWLLQKGRNNRIEVTRFTI